MFLAWAIISTFVAGTEFALWIMFRRKFEGLSFPRDADESSLGFFTRGRLKVITVTHGAFLIALFFCISFFLW